MSSPGTKTTHKMKKFAVKLFFPCIVIMLLFLSFSFGKNSATADLSGEILNYDKLKTVIAENQSELDDIQEKIGDKQKEYDELMGIISEKEKFENQYTIAMEKLAEMNGQLAELNKKIEAKKKELSALEGEIADKKD
ncbi:hypothetical protein [Peribacillus frigoritolerans]|uniref:hypothetical protein n=1 Tax=Peribacillus frigoritolerans TaxID=450367 RepID=UPI00105A1E92|nr:hypothetical protein [Peribacillus frigoritolerans]TDL78518.1 hypothetical protein E2R53_13685 [Peribacillus frigoritolerans]